ncbi:hypothetical protein AAKU58_003371 [Oxalobacteraceae bacterium GrIS 1.18]
MDQTIKCLGPHSHKVPVSIRQYQSRCVRFLFPERPAVKFVCIFLFTILCAALSCASFAEPIGLTRHSQNGVVYVSGGVGEDQQRALQIMRSDFNLQLIFAAKGSGEYLADVSIHIQSRAGINFVDTMSEGPIFLAKLPPGEYQITAQHGQSVQMKIITVDSNGIKELNYYW